MSEHIQGFRLSPQQRRTWSLSGGDASRARATAIVAIDGPLDRARLAGAIAQVIDRHEILRTAFQRVPGMRISLQVVEAAAAPDAITTSITQIAPGRHQLQIATSALCADAAGLEVMVKDIARAYAGDAGDAGGEDVMQYAVVSDWLNETLESEDSEAGVRFWQAQLADPIAAAPALGRAGEPAAAPGTAPIAIDAATTAAIERCAARIGVSPAAVVTAVFQIAMWRTSGGSALPIAALLDGRTTAELADVIGPLSRHVPVASAIEGEATVAQIAARIEAALGEACAWQECFDPDALLGGDGHGTERIAAQFLPFAVEYRTGRAVHTAGDAAFRVIASASQIERFALLGSFVRTPDGIDGELAYDARRYSATEAARIAARIEVAIASAVADAQTQVGALCVLPAAEERTVVVEFNATREAYAGPEALHRMFEAQVARTPDRTAVSAGDRSVTYRELDARANQLARRLRRSGVAANVPVGLLMERSIDMVVGIMGILKAGGAYIPLDAEYPQDRLAYMLGDARVTAVVTSERLAATLASPPDTVLRLDADWDEIAGEDATALDGETDPEDMAYVLYTSGSTGRPKGVMIPHRALCNHMRWMQQRFPVGESDSVLQKTPFSFDASVWEFYAPLFTGGRLVMAQPGGHRDAEYLCETIQREGITTIQLVPTLLRMLLEQPAFAECTSLARVYCGGEALPVDLRDRFHDVSGGDLINLYGPTECCIDATFHVCRRGEPGVPIGRPIANTEIYLLDDRRHPVPLGVPGELYIGGAGVGLGYLHNAQLTSERFIADPRRPGSKLYRTGDLGRFLADGSIEYLGRIDNQIKLRGHRIELGEIESTLARHAEIAACVVVVREDQPGDKRLAAYFVPRAGALPRGADLRHFLVDQLPEYMVPPDFVKLDQLPLMPNGKVDQRALPVPVADAGELADSFVAPRNPLEQEVAQIWCEVLGISQVGIHDDFFALGGHSLIATQLTSRIRKLFHVDLPLRELFAAPTVLGLSERIARLQAELAEQSDMADMLAELEGLSDEDAKALLSEPLAAAQG